MVSFNNATMKHPTNCRNDGIRRERERESNKKKYSKSDRNEAQGEHNESKNKKTHAPNKWHTAQICISYHYRAVFCDRLHVYST